ncbi:MAG: phage portal protein [Phascolarctobacterium sp.]|nr:phage portal protein [Phascolarctobacterium sp.]
MGFLEWLGIGGKPRDAPVEDAPKLPDVQDNVRDSGQTFMFGRAESGERVDEKSSLQIATVYACVRLLAETVAGLPLHLYRYTANGEKEMATDHPLYKILYRQPNPEMTSFSFRECMMTHLLLWGNAYAQIVRDGKNEILGLYPLMPQNVEIDRDEHGEIYYIYHRYQLAHLLEKGHALRQGGRAKAYPHIAPAEEAGETMLVQLIEKALS